MKVMNKLLLGAILILGISLYSCSGDEKEDVAGCTDSRAENYNPNATTSNNSCVYPNEKFFGKYVGSFGCGGALSDINQDMVEFELAPPANADDVDKVTLSATVGGIPLSLEGNVDGNTIQFVDKTIENITVLGFTVDVQFSGTATLSGNDLSAQISVKAGIISDTCSFSGSKQ